MNKTYIQDLMSGNHCFGCGPENKLGLQIKSFQNNADTNNQELICHFTPKPEHTTWVENYINGGIIASVIDCHSIWTSMAHAYQQEQREIGTQPDIIYVTANLNINYLKPTPAGTTLELCAKVLSSEGKKSTVECHLRSNDETYAEAKVLAIRVGGNW